MQPPIQPQMQQPPARINRRPLKRAFAFAGASLSGVDASKGVCYTAHSDDSASFVRMVSATYPIFEKLKGSSSPDVAQAVEDYVRASRVWCDPNGHPQCYHTAQVLPLIFRLVRIFLLDVEKQRFFSPLWIEWLRSSVLPLKDIWVGELEPDIESRRRRMIQLALTGEMESLHSLILDYDESADAVRFASLVREYPFFSDAIHETLFRSQWEEWRNRVRQSQVADDTLNTVRRILGGDDSAMKSESRDWMDLLTARILYRFPLVRRTDVLAKVVDAFQQPFSLSQPSDDSLQPSQSSTYVGWMQFFYDIVVATLQGDVQGLLSRSELGLPANNWWFCAHLSHILFVTHLLNEDVVMRYFEFFILDIYAVPALRRIAMQYAYLVLPGMLVHLADALPLTTEVEAFRWQRILDGMTSASKTPSISVCRRFVAQHLQNGRIASVSGIYAHSDHTLREFADSLHGVTTTQADEMLLERVEREFAWLPNVESSVKDDTLMKLLPVHRVEDMLIAHTSGERLALQDVTNAMMLLDNLRSEEDDQSSSSVVHDPAAEDRTSHLRLMLALRFADSLFTLAEQPEAEQEQEPEMQHETEVGLPA